REVLAHVAVESLHHGHHDEQEHDAEDDAEQAEEALQLLRPDLEERERRAFAQLHGSARPGHGARPPPGDGAGSSAGRTRSSSWSARMVWYGPATTVSPSASP